MVRQRTGQRGPPGPAGRWVCGGSVSHPVATLDAMSDADDAGLSELLPELMSELMSVPTSEESSSGDVG